MTQAVKRACDACHRRKVKCDGVNPCRNCASAQLSCTYNAVPQKKGPKGSRAKVISELRETQRQTSLAAKVQNRLHGVPCSGSASSPGSTPTPGLLTSELIKDCTNFFFDNMYAQLPILDRQQIEQQVLYMEQNHDAYCMLTSLCAFVMLQPGMSVPTSEHFNVEMVPGANIISCQLLIEETLRVRRGFEYLDNVTHNAVVTDFFIFACYYAQELHDRAWYHLREATTLVHMAGMNQEDHYMKFDQTESSRRRRLFWLLYATERAYAIQRNRPLSLQATINLPTLTDDPLDPHVQQLHSFMTLVSLFKPFDDAFVNTWNKTRNNMSSQHVDGLQKQLTDLVQSWMCQDPNFADQHINQSWLKSTVWQLTNGAVHGDDSLSYQYNANVSRDLLMSMASQFPGQGMELLNSGLIEKLMDITRTMVEYLSMQPAPRDPFAEGPREHMSVLLNIVALSRNSDHRFLPVLIKKVGELLPRLINPMLQNAPENHNMANIDIFDGFGNAGMAQVPPQMQMPMDTDYDRKFSAEEYDKQYAMEMNNTTPESQNNSNSSSYGQQTAPQSQSQDMKSSFVSSPSIMSPGMEYPPQMSAFASTPMSEMVMSPMGHPSQQSHMNMAQQQPHMPGHNHDGLTQHHMSMSQHMPTSHPMNNLRAMQQPQRQNSFHLQAPPAQMRTVGDFQGMQGRNDARPSIVGMGSMNNEIDFGALQ